MHLVIRRNGSIVIQEHGEPDRCVDAQDPFAILGCFRATFEFEEGLTAAQLMRALRPWRLALSSAGWIDFDAWARAMDKPNLEVVDDTHDSERLTEIVLRGSMSIHRMRKDGQTEVSIHQNWEPVGRMVGGEHEIVSISFVSPGILGHLPITIDPNLRVEEYGVRGGKTSILKSHADGKYDRIVERPSFFEGIILGFLDDISFHGSPEDTSETKGEILSLVAEVAGTE